MLAVSGLLSAAALDRWSLTFDELTYAPAGYDFLLTGRLRFNREKGPLGKALSALPLLALRPPPPVPSGDERGFLTGWRFFHPPEGGTRRLAVATRAPSIACGLLLGLLSFAWLRRRLGAGAALVGLAFLLLDPQFNAVCRLALPDIFFALFFFAALCALERALAPDGRRAWLAASGVAVGAASLAKLAGPVLLPLAALFAWRRRGPRAAVAAAWILTLGAAALAALVCGRELPELALGALRQAQGIRQGVPANFYLGRLTEHAELSYYPVAILLKTPWPFVAACAAGLWSLARRGERESLLWALAPAGLLIALSAPQHMNCLRYLVPAWPFLLLLPAAAWRHGGPRLRGALAALLLLQAVELAAVHPHELSYLNRPWRDRWDLLANSDFDWGQGLPDLSRRLAGRPAHLCYFGTVDPAAYGVRAAGRLLTVPGIPILEPPVAAPGPVLIAVSAGCRQFMTVAAGPGRRLPAWGWLDSRPAEALAGGTQFLYDATRDPEALARLGQLYLIQGQREPARELALRLRELVGDDERARPFLEAAL